MSTTVSRRKIDFLRHIVNRVLASSDVPQQFIDDVKKLVGKAEDKYKFDAFSGDIRKLADYIRSRDFDDLVTLLKSNDKGLEILKKILEEAKKAYSDIPEIVEAIDERLKTLGAETKETETRTDDTAVVREVASALSSKGFKISKLDEKNKIIEAEKDDIKVVLTDIKRKDGVLIVDTIEVRNLQFKSADDVAEKISKLSS
ncbi:hypothetical protein PYJP_09650 [Pyrofollis japonicus]|uniref:hypothetical protein n=1 Tax=Pyrofollis japonicus TaxID=3060460 RepID=UPI00295ABD64|nr:hypothetical protein [Pyrofollis japonicus]BEP17613.1 hypothetical protein PYJP_09650 [Pyrofollis japonicus]